MTLENSNHPSDTLVVNLYGGPGTGKSTSAAATYASLKMDGCNAELATEYAKEIVWEGRHYLLSDQLYIFAKQNRKLERLYNKVDVIVTDSPLLLCYYYSNNTNILNLINEMLVKARQLHIFLERKKKYNPKGRYQTEEEALEIDSGIYQMLEKLRIPFEEVVALGEVAKPILELIRKAQEEDE